MPVGPLVACATMQLPANPAQFFLERFGLSDAAVERVLGGAVGQRADWADAFFEYRVTQTASLEDGVVKKATRNVRQGVGVRVLAGARTGYAYSDEVTLERLEIAARTAQYIADRQATAGAAVPVPARAPLDLYAVDPAPVEHAPGRPDRAARAPRRGRPRRRPGDHQRHRRHRVRARVVLVATASGLRRRRRPAARAPERHVHRRAGRRAPAGNVRRRRAHRLRSAHRRSRRALRPRGGAAGAASTSTPSTPRPGR